MARILIMEDDEFQADALQAFMEDLGHEAEVSHSAREAYQILCARSFDILLTDLLVANPDEKGGGITLIKDIRGSGIPRLQILPIIAITGSSKLISPQLLGENAEFAGANRILMKPVNISDLNSTIQDVLNNTST